MYQLIAAHMPEILQVDPDSKFKTEWKLVQHLKGKTQAQILQGPAEKYSYRCLLL